MSPDTPPVTAGRLPGSRLAALALGNPRRTLLVALAVLVLGVVVGTPVAGKLASGGFNDPGSQTARANAAVLRATGVPEDSSLILLVRAGSDVTTGSGRRLVAQVADDLRHSEQVALVVDPVSIPTPDLVSTDHQSAYMVASLRSQPRLNEDVAHDIAATMQARYPQVTAGGYLVAFKQVGEQVGKDLGRAEALAGPILFLVLVLVLRGVIVALLPLAVGGLSIVASFIVRGPSTRAGASPSSPSTWSPAWAWDWPSTTACSSSTATARRPWITATRARRCGARWAAPAAPCSSAR